jgi:hypothetical protein
MQVLTDEGQKTLAEIAGRHGVSSEAAGQLLAAITAGGGRQAQFNHPELGGMGQWSQGGMIMIGDMFNQGLKARVAALCSDLAELVHSGGAFAPDQPQPWTSSSDAKSAKLFMLAAFGHRWPAELGAPTSTGSQNDMHYAIFPRSRRLAIERGGQITVYDTGDHRIGGVSQQQGSEQTLRLTSQSGVVSLSDLKIVGEAAEADEAAAGDTRGLDQQAPVPDSSTTPAKPAGGDVDDEIFSRLERLADLCSREIITAEEFAAKKAELLARL